MQSHLNIHIGNYKSEFLAAIGLNLGFIYKSDFWEIHTLIISDGESLHLYRGGKLVIDSVLLCSVALFPSGSLSHGCMWNFSIY